MSLQDFVILSKIGQGAYSSVHKVKRISDGNIYALKKVKINNLKEKQKQNALNEVRLLASISNENIIAYKEAFFDANSNTLCIVLEYADGGDLEKLIERKKKSLVFIGQQQIWKIVKQVTMGLAVLHDMKTIHRDLKSANIFISNGSYKLGDLNVSKLLKKSLAYTQTGTPYYASPEVWKDQPYQLKSDIWSLGCIVYEACALKPPFTASSLQGLFKKVSKGNYPRIPPAYSQTLQNFIAKCLQLNANKRPTCRQLLNIIPHELTPYIEDQRQRALSDPPTINLLSTIKVPRNLQSWREDLPKSNYEQELRRNDPERVSLVGKFGQVSQEKLRQIVKSKNQQHLMLKRDFGSRPNLTPELVPPVSIVHNPHAGEKSFSLNANYNYNYNYSDRNDRRYDLLPKIKLHSEPAERGLDLLNKLREDDKKKDHNYNYSCNRPVWWG